MVNPSLLNEYWKDSTSKQIEIKIIEDNYILKNELLWENEFSLTESLCLEDSLVFGACDSNIVKFKTADITRKFKGKHLQITIHLNNDITKKVNLGTYIVYEDTLSNDRRCKDIVAYDEMHRLSTLNIASWYNALSFPITLKNFRNSLFSYIGVNQENADLINDSIQIYKTIESSEMLALDVIKSICELNAVFGNITRNNTFKYVVLPTVANSATIDKSKYIEGNMQDFVTENISKLQLQEKEGDIGVIVGNGDNTYIISDNFLVYGKTTEELTPIANNIFNVIKNYSYRPYELKLKGNPCIEVGDMVTISTRNGITFDSYVLERVLSGVQALYDDFTAKGNEIYLDNVSPLKNDIKQLKGKSNVLERSIEETKSTITDVENGLRSEITQTAESFTLEIENLQKQIDGEVEVYYTDHIPTLNNYPAWDWTYNIPANNTVKLTSDDGIKFQYTDEWYRKHKNAVVYCSEDNIAYRFYYNNGAWDWKIIGDSEYTYVMQQLSELKVDLNGISANVQEIDVSLGNDYYTIAQYNADFEIKKNSIMQSVNTTYETKTDSEERYTDLSSRLELTDTSLMAEISRVESNLSTGQMAYDVAHLPTLNNYPAYDFTYNIPCNNTVQLGANGVKFEYTAEGYNLNLHSIAFNVLDYVSYSFEKKSDGTYYWKKLADSYYGVLSRKNAAFKMSVDEIQLELTGVENDIKNNYMTTTETQSAITQTQQSIELSVSETYQKQSAMEGYYTKTQTDSQISISTEGISQKVSKSQTKWKTPDGFSPDSTYYGNGSPNATALSSSKLKYLDMDNGNLYTRSNTSQNFSYYGKADDQIETMSSSIEQNADSITHKVSKGTISSEISQEAGKITLSSNRLVVNSTNFKLDANGNVALSGNVTATSGKIGGWSIDASKITASYYAPPYNNRIDIQSDGTIKCTDFNSNSVYWELNKNGTLFARNADINGKITATSGNIGGCSIVDGKLTIPQANVSNLSADIGNINSLLAKKIDATTVNSTYATITSLNAVDAKFGSLNANNITSGTLSADRIDISGIVNSNTFQGSAITVHAVTANAGITTTGMNFGISSDRHTVVRIPARDTNGRACTVLGWY